MEPRQQIRKAAADHSVKRKPAGKQPQQNKKTRAANNVNDEKGPKNDKDEKAQGEMELEPKNDVIPATEPEQNASSDKTRSVVQAVFYLAVIYGL